MPCRACVHPNRDYVDRALLDGVALRKIVAATGLSLGGLVRHKDHVRRLVRERTQEENAEHGTMLLMRVLRLADEADAILKAAKAASNFQGANGALNAAAKLLDLCARLSGELTNSLTPGIHFSFNKTVNVTAEVGSDEELEEFVQLLSPNEFERLMVFAQRRIGLLTCTNLAPSQEKPLDSTS